MLLSSFTFDQPWWLLALIALIPLFFLKGKSGLTSKVSFSSLSILVSLGAKPKNRSGALFPTVLILSLFFGILALSRPVLQKTFDKKNATGIDIVVALDLSLSMEIKDFYPNDDRTRRPIMRLDAAKEVIRSFIESRPNDRMGIVAFSGRPYSLSPITLDHNWLLSRLSDIRLGDIKEGGTAIGSAIAASSTRLTDRDAKSKIIVLVTDGASNSGKLDPVEAAELASKLGIKIYTVAIGTEQGRVSRRIQNFPKKEFDTTTLKNIAQATKGEFYRARSVKDLEDTFTSINKLEKSKVSTITTVEKTELFPWFVGLSLLLLFLSLLAMTLIPKPIPN